MGRTRQPFFAVQERKLESARLLLQRKANPNVIAGDGSTPLHYARSDEMLSLLLDNGAPCAVGNQPSKAGTVLHSLLRDWDKRLPYRELKGLMKKLFVHGVDLNCPDSGGDTVIDLFCKYHSEHEKKRKLVRLLTRHGATISPRALRAVIRSGSRRWAQIFMQFVAEDKLWISDGNVTGDARRTRRRSGVGSVLWPSGCGEGVGGEKWGADVNSRIEQEIADELEDGDTPLLAAMKEESLDKFKLIAYLVERGADPTRCNKKGDCPREIASKIWFGENRALLM